MTVRCAHWSHNHWLNEGNRGRGSNSQGLSGSSGVYVLVLLEAYVAEFGQLYGLDPRSVHIERMEEIFVITRAWER